MDKMTFYNSERLANLEINKGETRIIGVAPVKNSKKGEVNLVFREQINNPNTASSNNPLADLNAKDERFSGSKARLAWLYMASPDSAVPYFGEEHGALIANAVAKASESGEYQVLDIINPTGEGERLHIQITETLEADDFDKANLEKTAKTNGQGEFLYKGEEQYAIFVNADVVYKPNHQWKKHDGVVSSHMELQVMETGISDEQRNAKLGQDNQTELDKQTAPTSQEKEPDAVPQ